MLDSTISTTSGASDDVGELVQAFRAGDADAFAQLYGRYHPQVMNQALRCVRNADDARDLCQEVFITAFTKIAQLRDDAAFGGWLRTITVRLAINLSKRRRNMRQLEEQSLGDCSRQQPTAEQVVLADERRAIVRDRLDGLRELDRQTLSAFYLEGQSLREMSDRFDTRLGTIKRRLFDARQRLAGEVKDYANA